MSGIRTNPACCICDKPRLDIVQIAVIGSFCLSLHHQLFITEGLELAVYNYLRCARLTYAYHY